jgi:hypothetical protein
VKLVIMFVVSSLIASGCAGPNAPSPANVAGSWSGVVRWMATNGDVIPEAITMTLSQRGSAVTGTWNTRLRYGNVSGTTTSTDFSGTFTYNTSAEDDGTPCVGSMAVSGNAGGSTLNWSSPGVIENCLKAPQNISITLGH